MAGPAKLRTTNLPEDVVEDIRRGVKASYAINTNLMSKLIALIGIALIIATLVFLIKKSTKLANYTYIAYLSFTFIRTIYDYMLSGQVFKVYTNDQLREQAIDGTRTITLVYLGLFVVYMGITLFFTFRKEKELSGSSSGGGIDL